MSLINKKIHQRILEKKKKLDQSRPLSPALVARLKKQMMIEYTYNSNAIEGNTLTLRETQLVIEEGLTVNGKSITETLEAKNHPQAIEFIERLAASKNELTEEAILQLHKLIMSNITEDAGQYRTAGVRITGATFTPPPSTEVEPQMQKLLKWLQANPDELTPIEIAAAFHHNFVKIHPFSEGNGRTARLLMNALLMKHNYPFIVMIPKLDRAKYLKTLTEADLGNMASFVNFIARCVERALDMYLDALEEPEMFTLAEASKITPYSQEYLSLIARKGQLGAYKQGRNWVVSKQELERYQTSLRKTRKTRKTASAR